MSIIRPRLWTQQPQVPVGIDWGNPLTRGICGGFITGRGEFPPKTLPFLAEEPTRSVASPFTDLLPNPSIFGLSAIWSDDGAAIRVIGYKTGSPDARNFTFSARVKINTTPGSPGVVARTDATATGGGGTTIPLWQNAGQFDMRINGTDYTQAGTWTNGLWYDVVIVGTAGACRLYVNGALVINGAAAAAGTIQAWCAIGDVAGGGAASRSVEFGHMMWHNRAFLTSEIASLSANPWQIFSPRVT